MGYQIQVIIRNKPNKMVNKDIYNMISEIVEKNTGLKSQVIVRDKTQSNMENKNRIATSQKKLLR